MRVVVLCAVIAVLCGCQSKEERIKSRFQALAMQQAEQLKKDAECPNFDEWHYVTIEHPESDPASRQWMAQSHPGEKRYSVVRSIAYKPEIEVSKSDSLVTPYVGKLTHAEVWEALMTQGSSQLHFWTNETGKVIVKGEYFPSADAALAWGRSNAGLPSIGAIPAFAYRFNMDGGGRFKDQPCWIQLGYIYSISYGWQDGKWVETSRDVAVVTDLQSKRMRRADATELSSFAKYDKFSNPALAY